MIVRDAARRADVAQRAPHLRVTCIGGMGAPFYRDNRNGHNMLERSVGDRSIHHRRVWHREGRTRTF